MHEHDAGKPTVRTSRRTSLLTLGGAALAASVLYPPGAKAGKKNKAKKTCEKQVAACRQQLRDFCGGSLDCEAHFIPCCEPLADCRAGEAVECLYERLEQ